MGRMAAYTGQQITWDQAMNSQEKLVPETLDWNGTHEVAAMRAAGHHEVRLGRGIQVQLPGLPHQVGVQNVVGILFTSRKPACS